MVTTYKQEENDLKNFWSVESIGISPTNSIVSAEQFFQNYSSSFIFRYPDESYIERFLWKDHHPPLPTNFNICLEEDQLTSAMIVSEASKYDSIITDQSQSGFIERVQKSILSTGMH